MAFGNVNNAGCTDLKQFGSSFRATPLKLPNVSRRYTSPVSCDDIDGMIMIGYDRTGRGGC